ncbi:tetraspanin-1-like [Genypterus blacodes]|uniref:tetraspanin-1-like n=1 Tax=Genypterus blacodes TaxID=154954 RepID=UPI003F769BA2
MGCFGFLKVMMFAFNGIIFLAGAAILAVGIWVKVDSSSIFGLIHQIDNVPAGLSQVLNVGYLLIAIGAILLIIGFLGCFGAVKESRCMLMLFFIIVLLVFIAEVAGAVVILVFKPLAKDLIKKFGAEAVKSIKRDFGANPDVTGLWNSTMSGLKCCGFNNYTDFTDSPYYTNSLEKYPPQCCATMEPCDSTTAAIVSTLSVGGCFPKISSLIDDNIVVIGGVALGIAALELCAMVVSMTLYCQIGSKIA